MSWAEEAGGQDLLPGQCEETLNSPAFRGHISSRRGKFVWQAYGSYVMNVVYIQNQVYWQVDLHIRGICFGDFGA